MGSTLPRIFLVRHGETEWSTTRRHTSSTDIPLTEVGEADARRLGQGLHGWRFRQVLTSPLQRAFRTCELSGFGEGAEVVPDLVEFRYGDYEGLTTAQIRAQRPGWAIFRDGCPGGDSVAEACARADRVVARLREARDDVAVFSHAHFIRSLAARWIGLEIGAAARFTLATASVSILGYDHGFDEPVIRLWNDVSFRGGVPE